mmetsp:Transcript_4848/g.7293  ORF Transcript_4848/g.7293 Transcript_4848/m.7293 type:complete len:239 (-) Transcript_4848:24-740(-)
MDLAFAGFNPNTNQPDQSVIQMKSKTHNIPLRCPPANPLKPNEVITIDLQTNWPLSQYGFDNLKSNTFKMSLRYISNGRNSPNLPVSLPFNVLHLITPFRMESFEFTNLQNQIKGGNCKFQPSLYVQKQFNLDTTLFKEMTKFKKMLTLDDKGKGFRILENHEAPPNVLCFAGQFSNSFMNSFRGQSTRALDDSWITGKATLNSNGQCHLELCSCKDLCGVVNSVGVCLENLLSATAP